MKLNPSFTLKQLSELINAKYIGNHEHLITGINEIHQVEAGDVTFVDHPKYYSKALNSNATTIIINKEDVECPKGKALIISNDPFKDYNFLTRKFRPFSAANKLISDSAKIGEGTVIQPGAFIGNNVTIGKNCLIHANASIYDNVIIGNNVIIHSGTVLGADAFYFQKRADGFHKMHSCGNVIIEDKVEIGGCCTIDKGVSGDTIIGEDTKLDNHIHVGHDVIIGKRCLFASFVGIAGCTRIEDDVILWAQVGVSKDLVIAKGTIVLAQSGVGKSTKPGQTYFGTPAINARERMKIEAALKYLPQIFKKIKF